MKFLPLLLALFLSFTAPALAAEDAGEGIIGTILEVEGAGTVTPQGKGAVKAAIKTPVHMNDLVATGPKSRIFILFVDETQITLSENAKLKVDRYVFNPDNAKDNKATFSIFDGAFKYVSGLVSKKERPDVNIQTNFGNIGIRGTQLWGGRIKENYGVHVTEGQVQVRNDGGAVVVDKGKGTFVKSRKEKPSAAAPFPAEAMQFIQSSVFLMGEAMLMQRIGGFKGENMILRGKFKNFQQLQGILPIPGGGNLPIPGGNGFPFPGGVTPDQNQQYDNGGDQKQRKKDKQQQQKQKSQTAPNPGDMLKGMFGR